MNPYRTASIRITDPAATGSGMYAAEIRDAIKQIVKEGIPMNKPEEHGAPHVTYSDEPNEVNRQEFQTALMNIDRAYNQRMLGAIWFERVRQEMLRNEGKFPNTCSDVPQPQSERLAYLAEEFGEVAREVAELTMLNIRISHLNGHVMSGPDRLLRFGHTENLKTELLQVAAICLAWLEGLKKEEEAK